MLFVAIAIILAIAYVVQYKVYKKYAFSDLVYKTRLDAAEVTVGDDLYMYEELTNNKSLPIPYIKVTTTLPEGLAFRIHSTVDGKEQDTFASNIDSMFVLKGYQRIKRRWRINCRKRGIYSLGDSLLVSNDLIGFNPISSSIKAEPSKLTTVTVLPTSVDLERDFASTRYFSGDVITNQSLLTDPMLRSGARDYTPLDPMSKINWKLTASHAHLMVNIEEFVQKVQSNIVLNMCSQLIERSDDTPEKPEFIEYNITVVASLLERFTAENVPVKLIANTPPEAIHADYIAGEDEIGSKVMITPPFIGKFGYLDAMRTLATLPMQFSMPIEKLLDYILENPHLFAENGNIVFVTAVLDGRMLVFHEQMRKRGIEVIFYVTTSNRGVGSAPSDMKVFYRTYFDSYKVGDTW